MNDLTYTVERVPVGPLGTNCYIIAAADRSDCVIIDPGADAARIRQALMGRTLAAILLTHGHFDHIGAVDELMETNPRLFIHRDDAPLLSSPELNASWLMGSPVICHAQPELLSDGDQLSVAGLSIDVLHTPGHTPGGACYIIGNDLFSGDTLFEHGYGRTDLAGGNESALIASLRRLWPLTRDHRIHGGHG